MSNKARPFRRSRAAQDPEASPPSASPGVQADDMTPAAGVPAHVWSMIQGAGAKAAERLLELLESAAFRSYPPTAQARLIELAMVRAYGLPVRRSVEITVNADAVADSLAALADSLPERGARSRPGAGATIDGTATSGPLRRSQRHDA